MGSAYILECEKPLPLPPGETPNGAFLLACKTALEGQKIWNLRKIEEQPVTLDSYGCEVAKNENGVLIRIREYSGIKRWISTHQGRRVKEIAKETLVATRRDKHFYLMQADDDALGIKAIICLSTL